MNCPHCLSTVDQKAIVCAACTRVVHGKICSECAETVHEQAKRCMYCGNQIEAAAATVAIEPFELKTFFIGTVLGRGSFLPQTVQVHADRVTIITPGPFNLSQSQEEIPWHKVAGFKRGRGIFWDSITIETRGQTTGRIVGLKKEEAERMHQVLSQVALD